MLDSFSGAFLEADKKLLGRTWGMRPVPNVLKFKTATTKVVTVRKIVAMTKDKNKSLTEKCQ